MIYLDHAATTPIPTAVADAMYAVLTKQFGNPSSQYAMGLEMKKQLERWRETVAAALGCQAKQLFFTSCGTEGDNWAITKADLDRQAGKYAGQISNAPAQERRFVSIQRQQEIKAGHQ